MEGLVLWLVARYHSLQYPICIEIIHFTWFMYKTARTVCNSEYVLRQYILYLYGVAINYHVFFMYFLLTFLDVKNSNQIQINIYLSVTRISREQL